MPKNKLHFSRNWLTNDLESDEFFSVDDKLDELKGNGTQVS